jgi:hypothetical protein
MIERRQDRINRCLPILSTPFSQMPTFRQSSPKRIAGVTLDAVSADTRRESNAHLTVDEPGGGFNVPLCRCAKAMTHMSLDKGTHYV